MNFRRTVLKASLVALACGAGAVYAQNNVLRVATDATFPPMEFVENGKKTGFDVELVEAVAAKMGKKVEWVDIDFKGLVPGLVAKRYDMAVSAIYITDERKKVVDFTQPYYAGGLVAMVKEGSPIAKLTDRLVPAPMAIVRRLQDAYRLVGAPASGVRSTSSSNSMPAA